MRGQKNEKLLFELFDQVVYGNAIVETYAVEEVGGVNIVIGSSVSPK